MIEFKMTIRRNPKKIIKCVNVYSVRNNRQGFGDYIRGCFCMIQISNKQKIPFDMDISRHPLHKWLQSTTVYPVKMSQLDQINYMNCNREDRLSYIQSNLNKAEGVYTFFCNEFPINPIQKHEVDFIRNKILPSNEMKQYVQKTKNNWGVSAPYSIIHLRCGDKCLLDGKPPNYDLFLREIRQIKIDLNKTYIILSDSYQMKLRLHELYPSFIVPLEIPLHTYNCSCSEEDIKDTMRDFFLFTGAEQVYSFSVYGHGSGFSEWPCRLYNVPYHAKHLHN
jgi:hypothetical protein